MNGKRIFFPVKLEVSHWLIDELTYCLKQLCYTMASGPKGPEDFTLKQWKISETTTEFWKINGALRRSSATVHEEKASLPLLLPL